MIRDKVIIGDARTSVIDLDSYYMQLLDRLYKRLPERKESKTIDLPELEIEHLTNKTIIKNLQYIAERLDRDPKIISRYFLKELGKPGSLTSSGTLEIYDRISAKSLNELFDKFIKTYVRCPTCGSIDTKLIRRGKIFIIKCLACGAETTAKYV
ncbi:MAG: translation initiation factor IF-2 subunit beta [Sulfolobales archaeon]